MITGHTTKLCIRISPFVWSLYKILSEQKYDDMIAWERSGTRFVIKDPLNLASKVLPQYYETNKFASFSRQLNIYGFCRTSDRRKTKRSGDTSMITYSHRHFRRDQPNSLHLIQRRLGPYSQGRSESPIPRETTTSTSPPSSVLSTFSPTNTPPVSQEEKEFQPLKQLSNTCSNCKILCQEIGNLRGLIQYYMSILNEQAMLNGLKFIDFQNPEIFSPLTSPLTLSTTGSYSLKETQTCGGFYSDPYLYNNLYGTSTVDIPLLPAAPYY